MRKSTYIKDLARYRKQERERQRIIVKAQRDLKDFRDKSYWEDMFDGMLYGALFTIGFLTLCCTVAYVFAKLTL